MKEVNMLKMPKEDNIPMDSDGIIRISDRQRFEIGHAPRKTAKWQDEILNMVSMASHDIRGSVVSIAAALKLMKKGFYGEIDEGVSREIETLLEKMAGLVGIVEESLSRGFCLNNELDQRHEKLDLHADILEPVLNELSKEILDKDVVLYNALRATSEMQLKIKGNRFLLKAVMRNLLKNAMKYGGQGTRIAIGFRNSADHIIVNIYNSGRPVPQEYRDRLFKKFDRVSPESKSPEGIGLGLYLVKEIVKSHGGSIRYEARKHGSNFIFTLPKA
jgi:signal transduction histidine kinase